MWWGCIPITTAVSCVPQMLGNGERGYLVLNKPEVISEIIVDSLKNPDRTNQMKNLAKEWSRQYTLERFEEEILKLLAK